MSKQRTLSPKQAGARRRAIDLRLDHVLFRALSDPTRLRLVACVAKCGRMCSVTEVAQCCSVDFSVVSRHLAMLADAGVLRSRKIGRTMCYRVRYGPLSQSLRRLADAIDECCPDDVGSSCKGGRCGGC